MKSIASFVKKSDVSVPTPAEKSDVRIGQIIQKEPNSSTRFALIGFPSDSGVVRNGGRAGASEGPDAIRKLLYKFTPNAENPADSHEKWGNVVDLGNVEVANSKQDGPEADQQKLGSVVKWCFEHSIFPVVLGGGHETAFGHYLGYASTAKNMHCINIDAHLDVRPYPDGAHSGSPFREMLESKPTSCQRYDVIGVQRHSASAEHVQFVRNHGDVVFRESITPQTAREIIEKSELPIYLSIDLDVLDQSVAPGVSAPAVNGLKLQELIDIIVPIAQSGRLASVDIVELNPRFDVDNHTGRLAAWVFYTLVENL